MFGRKDPPENVRLFPVEGGKSKVEMPTPAMINEVIAGGNYLRAHEKELIENFKVLARLHRAKYLAYIEVGFSQPQALELCTRG